MHYKIISFLAAWLITPRYLLLTVFGVDGVASIVDVNGPLSYTFLWPLESLWDAMTVWRGGSCPSSTTKMIFPRCTNATQHSDLVYIFSNSEEEFSSLFWLLLVFLFFSENFQIYLEKGLLNLFSSPALFLPWLFWRFFLNLVLNVCISSWTICQVSFWSVPLIMLSTLRKILSKTDVVTNYVKRGKLLSHTSKLLEIYWFWC